MMRTNHLTKKQYLNFVSAVAILHNCRLIDIDFPKHVIQLEGAPNDMNACFHELSMLLGKT